MGGVLGCLSPCFRQQRQSKQQQVRGRHFDSRLISEAEKIVMKDENGDPNLLSYFYISTTIHSNALIVIESCKDQFPYNSYSNDSYNPWLITGYARILKPEFFTQLNEYWKVPADWTICPFRVYEWNGNEWVARNLDVVPQNKVVRVRIKDQTFWSHPPRPFEVLENACSQRSNVYKQKKGNLKKHLKSFQEVDSADSQIPEDQKPERKDTLKKSIEKTFNEIYELVDNLEWDDHNQLTSYRYPTFQMAANKTYTPTPTPTAQDQRSHDHDEIRYGNDSSGVYENNSDEVHYRFEKEGTKPIPKPTKKVLWNWVVKSLKINIPITYEEVFEEEETDN